MSDLGRRARRLVGGWPSGGLVVGLLPDSSHRAWSGKAALELATAAADDRLAALVLDLAPDDSDLADRFGADPEPGFAQVMTGEVELSQIQHWDAGRGAYYLPGGVRILSDKVAKSRSVEALAERVRGQEGVLFVLLDRHAAEAAAEAGWLDGVVRLGDAALGGPTMFSDVDPLGRLDRHERVEKPREREAAEAAPEPAEPEPAGAFSDTGTPDESEAADLTVEPDDPATQEPEAPGSTPEPRETERPLEPAASAESDVGTGSEAPAEPGEAEVGGTPTIEISEEAWEPRATAGTEVLDRPDEVEREAGAGRAADAEITSAAAELAEEHGLDVAAIEGSGQNGRILKADVRDAIEEADASGADAESPELEVVDASAADADDEAAEEESPVLEVPEELWESAEAGGEPGVDEEPEIAAEADEVEDVGEAPDSPETEEQRDRDGPELEETAEVETEPAPAGPHVVDEPEVDEAPAEAAEAEAQETAEVEPEERRSEAEVTESAEEAAPQTADGAEVETADEEEAAEREIADGEEGRATEAAVPPAEVDTEAEPAEPEITGEPELSESPREAGAEVGAGRETSDAAEAEETDEAETPGEPPEAEVEEPAGDEIDRPAGLERFAEIPQDSAETGPARDAGEEQEEGEDADESGEAPAGAPAAAASEASDDEAQDGEAPEEDTREPEPGPEPAPAAGPREPVHADIITSGLEVWPDEQPVTAAEADGETIGADDEQEPETAAASVISAALWARQKEDGRSEEPAAPASQDFITPAMWGSDSAGPTSGPATVRGGSAAVISGGQWAPAAGAGEAAEAAAPDEPAATEEAEESAPPEEPAPSGEPEGTGEHERADFILDGLELPPEWSEEWEEEERSAREAADREDPDASDGAEPGSEDDGVEATGKADFVTQGLGIPTDEPEGDDAWGDSGPSTGWSRDSGSTAGTWERDPYGSSTGRAAAATAARPERQGLALSRRAHGGGELWKKARTAAIVVLTVGSLGVFGSAVVDSGALGTIGDVATRAVSSLGDGATSDDGGSGNVAAAGAGGSGAATAAGDSARSTPSESEQRAAEADSEAPPAAGDGQGEATPAPVTASPAFRALTDSIERSVEEYSDRMDLYREREIGCPLLMSAREEAGRLFVRLSMFRLSGSAAPDSVFRTAHRRLSEDMEWVEQSYAQTDCPRPSTATPAESVPGGPPLPEPSEADSAAGAGLPPHEADTPADSAGAGEVADDSVGVAGGGSLPADSIAGQVGDTTPPRPASDTTSGSGAGVDSASDGQPADTTSTAA